MASLPMPVTAPSSPATAAAPADAAPSDADFLTVLAGLGTLQWPPAAAGGDDLHRPSPEQVLAEAPADGDLEAPESIVAVIGLLLAAPEEPAPGAVAAGTEPGLALGPTARDLHLRLAMAAPETAGVLEGRDAPEPARSSAVTATAHAADSAAGRPAPELAESRPQATTQVPVGHPRWATAVGHEVRLLMDRGLQAATLRLSPEHLGPLEVRIEVADDRAQVWFGATHAETRTALADALPRLREMFEAAGLQLADAGVHRDAPRDPGAAPAARNPGQDGTDPGEVGAVTTARLAAGLVDEYA